LFLKIRVPLGSKVLRIPEEIGYYGDEDEVLLDRGATFVRTGEPDVEFLGRKMISLEYIPKKRKHVKNQNQYTRYKLRLGINKECDVSILKKHTINNLEDSFENIIRMASKNKDSSCMKNILKTISKSYTITNEDLETTLKIFDIDSLLYIYNQYPHHRFFLINSILNKTRKFDPKILKMLIKLVLDEKKFSRDMIEYIINYKDSINTKDFELLQSILKRHISDVPKYLRKKLKIAGFDLGLAEITYKELEQEIDNYDLDLMYVYIYTDLDTIDKTLKLLSSKFSFLNPKNEKENDMFWLFALSFENPSVLKHILTSRKKFPFRLNRSFFQRFLDAKTTLKIKEENYIGSTYDNYNDFKKFVKIAYGDEVYAKVF